MLKYIQKVVGRAQLSNKGRKLENQIDKKEASFM
jgi:hypothetical protein